MRRFPLKNREKRLPGFSFQVSAAVAEERIQGVSRCYVLAENPCISAANRSPVETGESWQLPLWSTRTSTRGGTVAGWAGDYANGFVRRSVLRCS